MKIMKHATNSRTSILKGVSTLDEFCKNMRIVLLLVIITSFSGAIYAGHSILDLVDTSFNPNVQTNSYGVKWVSAIQALPDGKLLALGGFNTYNGVPVGKLVRLNADGSLDTTFDNQTVTAVDTPDVNSIILVQPDGKIVLKAPGLVTPGHGPTQLLRLNADGTFDSTFNFTQANSVGSIFMDSLGRLLLLGNFTTPNGPRRIIRLNDDGSLDSSFNFTLPANTTLGNMAIQGNKPIVMTSTSSDSKISRLNEDGSNDASFTPFTGAQIYLGTVQPDNKILYSADTNILRLNENGGNDGSFQSINLSQVVSSLTTKFTSDGKIVFMNTGSPATFKRFLPTGAIDPSFNQYTTTTFASYTIQSGDNIVMGDGMPFQPSGVNNFVRLTSGGAPDPTFNPGGTGFQNVMPGVIQAIDTYPDGKILFGGKFDLVNGVSRTRLARLNADSTVDNTFQLNTSGSGNYFSVVREIYQVRVQPDGKIIVSGWFDYVLNGVAKINFVRLNSDGSIDPTFNLNYTIFDYSQINVGGQNRFALYGDGRLMVGVSKGNSGDSNVPIRFTAGGTRDTSFNSTLNSTRNTVYIHDVALQPDGKVLASGQYPIGSNNPKSFLGRLNSDGSMDSTFPYTEESAFLQTRLALLPSGKILIIKSTLVSGGSAKIQRLNSNGSVDSSFNTVTLSDTAARLNALLVLPNGKIFVGGRFTITVNGQQTKNLLKLDADGHIEATTYNVNEEVLCLALDSEGRILVGGGFTVIGTNGAPGATRSYVARLTDSTQFDFDGDGKADLSVFRPSENKWYILRSSDGQVMQKIFATDGDIPMPVDYDGDGKTDIAIYRPSSADWWSLSTVNGNQVFAHWGEAGVVPLPSDFDGDGKSDYIFFQPANSTWYRYGSSAGASYVPFGIPGDKPVTGDFDGDGKSDPAIFRPSTGDWWYAASSAGGQHRAEHWGISTDIPAPADYDGDGKTDFAVYRPSVGAWYIFNSSGAPATIMSFGISEDKPVPADYDGDGKADIAVFRPSNGAWYLLRSTSGFTATSFGISTDIPTPNAFVP
jgi:uncharacterized delta-60 repeat protein